MRALLLCAAALLPATAGAVDSGADFGKKVTEFTLSNGLHFVILERHGSPLVSFHTYIQAGAVDLPAGQTGLASLLVREAWEGTDRIGTRDAAAEKKALAAVEDAADRLAAERNKGPNANGATVVTFEMQYQMALDHARSYRVAGEYERHLTGEGATGLGATVNADSLQYYCTLPSNRIELWFSLESQRLAHPVFRNFYADRDRMAEELRVPSKDKEISRLLDQLAQAAFVAHPYRNPLEGWPGDVENLRLTDANAFAAKYFVPGNVTIAVAGDVNPAEARRLADRYFAAWPARPLPAPVHTLEPEQTGPRTFIASLASTPMVAFGYKRPDQYDRDDTAFDLLEAVLAAGPDSWLGKELAREKKLILRARVDASFPGGRYPPLFAMVLAPAPGHTLDEIEAAWGAMLAQLQTKPFDEGMLARAKGQARANVLARLEENDSAAALLATASANSGSWKAIFQELDELDRLTAADLQRVALKYFVAGRRTIAYAGITGPGTPVPQPGAQK